ncbi:MAG: hypothetical protein R3A46_19350 [Thermomicrobiales bacterium]
MIVRIVGEGQYRLDDILIDDLNELDRQLQADLEAGDAEHFAELLHQMAALVHERGTPVADDELVRSDAILPPEDATVEKSRRCSRRRLDPGLRPRDPHAHTHHSSYEHPRRQQPVPAAPGPSGLDG